MPDWRAEIRARLGQLTALRVEPAHEADLIDELAAHLEDQFKDLRARGIAADAARAALFDELNDDAIRDAVESWRDAHPSSSPAPIGVPAGRGEWLATTWQDLQYGWRSLRRSPVFTVVAVLSLALGIGATTAIFGLLHSILLQRLALHRPEQIVGLHRAGAGGTFDRFAYSEFETLRRMTDAPRIEAWYATSVTTVMRNTRDYLGADFVSGGFFGMVGVRPLLGRVLSPDDERTAAPVAVLSQDLWERYLEADPSSVGKPISINGQSFIVVGVLPRSYRGLVFERPFAMALPFTTAPVLGLGDLRAPQGSRVNLFARLTHAARDTSMLRLAFERCCADAALPGAPKVAKIGKGAKAAMEDRQRLVIVDASRGVASPKYDMRGEYRRILIALMAGVVILLLIACANVGNLLLARAATRQRELAVRMSMGATHSRLVRQLLTECLELGAIGGVVGFLLARSGLALLSHNLPPSATIVADMISLRPSPIILGFTVLSVLACTLLFGILPAMRATRGDIVAPLKDGARGTGAGARTATDRSIIVVQVALALVLVSAATLFVATLRRLKEFDGGYHTNRVLLALIETRGTIYERQGIGPLYADILDRVRRIPEIEAAALSSTLPVFGGRSSRDGIHVPGYEPRGDEDVSAWFAGVSPNFFLATGIGLERGRDFDAHDVATSEKVAIVSAAFAKRFFADRDPIGKSFVIGGGTTLRVVGVARDARFEGLRSEPSEIYYAPLTQANDWPFLDLAARTRGDPLAVVTAVRRQIEASAPGIRIGRIMRVEQALDDELARERLAAALATIFGCVALALAAVGLYGLVAYNVDRRTHEIGVRMALGARSSDVLWLIVRQSLVLTGLGVVIGVPAALIAGRGIASQLYGIAATDPRVLTGAAMLLLVVGASASALPGRRAARVDPVQALRAE